MNDDELRARLARLDPQAHAPVDPITSPRAQDLLERTMTTTEPYVDSDAPAPRPNRQRALLAAAAAVIAATGVVLVLQDDSPSAPAAKDKVSLTLPSSSVMQSCVVFDAKFLKDYPTAFAAKATAVGADSATLDVTKWYRGGTADQVVVKTADAGSTVSIDSVAFATGKSYLVSATEDGSVSSCGFSGEDTPQLRAAFEEAYGG